VRAARLLGVFLVGPSEESQFLQPVGFQSRQIVRLIRRACGSAEETEAPGDDLKPSVLSERDQGMLESYSESIRHGKSVCRAVWRQINVDNLANPAYS